MTKRYEYCLNFEDETYVIADMTGKKTLQDFLNTAKKQCGDRYSKEEIEDSANWEYGEYIYNHGLDGEEVCDLLNKQEDEIQHWKQIASAALNENSILHNELCIAMEQGYTLSEPYMEYKESVRNNLTKVTKRILEKED